MSVLANTELYGNINEETVLEILQEGRHLPAQYKTIHDSVYANMLDKKGGELTLDDTRMIQVCAYAILNCE